MKVFYNTQIFCFQKWGEISKYFYELLNNLNSTKSSNFYLPFMFLNNSYNLDSVTKLLWGNNLRI